jgi:hypothetical protein
VFTELGYFPDEIFEDFDPFILALALVGRKVSGRLAVNFFFCC